MRFETKREREQRRKRQKRSAILGMVFAMLVVVGLGVLLWNGKKNIEAKNVEYEKQIKELQEQVDEEKQRTEELNEYKKYVQTKKFAEEIAKDKFGLIYPDEIIFKGRSNVTGFDTFLYNCYYNGVRFKETVYLDQK